MRFDVCNLGRTEVILGMPWLAAHNPDRLGKGRGQDDKMPTMV